MPTHRFRALTTDVQVEVDDAELEPIIAALLASYGPPSAAPALAYRIERGGRRLWRGSELIAESEHPLDAPSALELDLYRQVVAACGDGVVLHAAALALGGRAVVLAGVSGAGKTTLALGLLARGADYLTEECALVRADGTVAGLARPITRLPDDDAAPPPGFERREIRRRLAGGQVVRRALLVPPPERVRHAPAPLAAIVAIERDAGRPTEQVRLPGVDALAALQPLAMNAGAGALAGVIAAASALPIYRLRSRTAAEALAAIELLSAG